MKRMSRKELMDRRRVLEPGVLTCPLLDKHGKCMVYTVRPMICRLFGSAKSMKCPHKEYTDKDKLLDDDLRIFMRYRKSAKIYDLAKLVWPRF